MKSIPHKILAVDDEPAILRLLERLLYKDYEVFCAFSGVEAVELLRQEEFAVVLTDQRMPGLTGVELLRLASKISPPSVRIILTGYTDADRLSEAIREGLIYQHIIKPWNNENLKMIVMNAVEVYEYNSREDESLPQLVLAEDK